MRDLQLASEVPTGSQVTVVFTAEDLRAAVRRGDEHIEIQADLEFNHLDTLEGGTLLGTIPPSVKSITANCPRPSALVVYDQTLYKAPTLPVLPGQCSLAVYTSLLKAENTKLWLHNLYVGLWIIGSTHEGFVNTMGSLVEVSGKESKVWVTASTFQGEEKGIRTCDECGIAVNNGAAVFVERCKFAHFDGHSAVWARQGSRLAIFSSYFGNNNIIVRGIGNRYQPGAVVVAESVHSEDTDGSAEGNTEVIIQGCEMSTNTSAIAPNLMTISQAPYSAAIHSDALDLRVCGLEVQTIEGLPQVHNNCTFNTAQPLSVEQYNMRYYDRARVSSMSEEIAHLPAFYEGKPPWEYPENSTRRLFIGVGPAVAAFFMLTVLISCCCMHALYRKRPVLMGCRSCSVVKSTLGSTTVTQERTIRTPPGQHASEDERMQFLQYQLDTLAGRDIIYGGGRLSIHQGAGSRTKGGQAVVQFATHHLSRQERAIKFFLSKSAFVREAAQYGNEGDDVLRKFLPRCYDIILNEDEGLRDAHGGPMPPCIVMERGESLDVWVQRNIRGMDQFTCMQIIHHICECLMDLHSAGYVHRDLKPGNIMWLPSQNRWTLIDFGCAARNGTCAPTGFTLAYAAPEAVHACFRAGRKDIEASLALDAWSLGVLCVELFSGSAPVSVYEGREKVISQILGEQALPWEIEEEGQGLLKSAGRFQKPILGLLQREHDQRLTVNEFMQEYLSVVALKPARKCHNNNVEFNSLAPSRQRTLPAPSTVISAERHSNARGHIEHTQMSSSASSAQFPSRNDTSCGLRLDATDAYAQEGRGRHVFVYEHAWNGGHSGSEADIHAGVYDRSNSCHTCTESNASPDHRGVAGESLTDSEVRFAKWVLDRCSSDGVGSSVSG